MPDEVLVSLSAILVLGISAQWLAWRLRLPSILLLLTAGILAGPVTGFLHPDKLLGDLLLPLVTLCVAVILYEGGLNLRLGELAEIQSTLIWLTTVGVVVSWMVGTVAAYYLLGLGWPVASLLAAILVVTGPTVIGPLLRHLRLKGKVGSLLKWEGIVIDPIGAILAVLVFTVLRAGRISEGTYHGLIDLVLSLLIGTALGLLAACLLALALRRFWIPDTLHNPVSLMLVLATFTLSNHLKGESGLVAVTVMGIALANQKWVAIRHLVEFKENLTILLISSLFIVLAARLQPDQLRGIGINSFLFVGCLILVARPCSVWLSTLGSNFNWRERIFLSFMAPRGIVAAAITSVLALEMIAIGYDDAKRMVPTVFLVVFVTVFFYGLLAPWLVSHLELSPANPQGFLFVGAHEFARAMAAALKEAGIAVVLVDTDWDNIRAARMAGLPCYYGSALAEQTRDQINFSDLIRMIAVTANNEVNSLACSHFVEDFGRQEVYQLPFSPEKEGRHEIVPKEKRGRFLFGADSTFEFLTEGFRIRPEIKMTRLTKEFDYHAFQKMHGKSVIPLFVLKENNSVVICTADEFATPQVGDAVMYMFSTPRNEVSAA